MNTWWYGKGVSRIQVRVRLPIPVFFLSSEDPSKIYELETSRYALTEKAVTGTAINDFAWNMT